MSDNPKAEEFWLRELSEFPRSDGIPPLILQTFPTATLPASLQRSVDRMKELNPGWEHRLFDENACERLIADQYGDRVLEIYRSINPDYGPARADLFRYLAVYALGGVYLDIKSYISVPIDQLIHSDDRFVTAHWDNAPTGKHPGFGQHIDLKDFPQGELQQWHVIAARGHPFLRAVVAKVLSRVLSYRPWREGVGRPGVLRITGPIAYTQAIAPLLDQHPHRLIADPETAGLHYSLVGDYDHKAVFKRHYATLTTPIVALPSWAWMPARLYGWLKERRAAAAG